MRNAPPRPSPRRPRLRASALCSALEETCNGKDEGRHGRRAGDGEGRRLRRPSACPARRSTRCMRRCASAASIAHVLARHVEGASHMAEGYTRAVAGNIGVCIGTSGPGRHRHDHRACIRRMPTRSRSCASPARRRARGCTRKTSRRSTSTSIVQAGHQVGVTVREPAQVPRAFQQAFHLMRSGRPGPVLIDLPFDVQMAEIEFDIDTYEPLPVYKPTATRKQVEKAHRDAAGGRAAADRRRRRHHQRRRVRAAGGVRRADRRAGDPDADGLGHDPRRPPADGRHVRPADQPPLRQRDDAGERLRARHRQPLGEPPHRLGRGLLQGPQVRARRHRADADRPRVRARPRHRVRRQGGARAVRRRGARDEGRRQAEGPQRLGRRVPRAQAHAAAQDQLRNGADEAAARLPVHEQQLPARHHLRQRRSA